MFTKKKSKIEAGEAEGGEEAGEAEGGSELEAEVAEGDDAGRWFIIKDLPDDIMQLILQRLSLSDYLYCRDVSRYWRAQIDSSRWLPAAHQLPWLLSNDHENMQTFYMKTDGEDDDGYSLVRDRKIIFKPKKDMKEYTWYSAGAIEGWLIMVSYRYDGRCFFFLNPVSGARVMLPLRHNGVLRVRKAVASSVPTTTNCYVTTLHFDGILAFCTPVDKAWTLITAALSFMDIEVLDEKLYAVGRDVLEFVMVFDIHLDTHDSMLHTYTSHRLVTLHPNVRSITDHSVLRRNCYLAKCSESKDLFLILYQDPRLPCLGNEFEFEGLFQVLKLEYNVSTGSQWVEITDLDDRALYIGTLNNIFITPHDKTVERNCIYFALWKQGGHETLNSGVFSLTDRSIKPMTIPKHHPCGVWNETIWLTPTPWN